MPTYKYFVLCAAWGLAVGLMFPYSNKQSFGVLMTGIIVLLLFDELIGKLEKLQ